jgi:hypothetical protein
VESQPSAYLLIISDREALAWILSSQRMAFPELRSRSAARLRPNDNLLLYTTSRCFGNSTNGRGRVIGHATVQSDVTVLDTPIEFGVRRFPVGCSLSIDALAPHGAGVELAHYVPRMHAFPNASAWSVYLRRTLVALDDHDFKLLLKALGRIAVQPGTVVSDYVVRGRRT